MTMNTWKMKKATGELQSPTGKYRDRLFMIRWYVVVKYSDMYYITQKPKRRRYEPAVRENFHFTVNRNHKLAVDYVL